MYSVKPCITETILDDDRVEYATVNHNNQINLKASTKEDDIPSDASEKSNINFITCMHFEVLKHLQNMLVIWTIF